MKKDAHYYAVLAFCRACGFKKESAHQAAYASQFVDDAKINHIGLKEEPGSNIVHNTIDGRPSFFNMATCHSYTLMKTFNYNAMTNNTCAFHFVPGCKGKLFPKKLRCSEASPVIEGILNEALKENDLVKLGMVLHPYADSFSHQGFSGLLSRVNDIKDLNALSRIPWGWFDRIKRVAKWVFKNKFDRHFDALLARKTDKKREKNWRKVLVRNGLFKKDDPQLHYDKNGWLKAAFSNFEKKKFDKRKVEGAELAPNFSDTNWYKYYLAVKWYKDKFYNYCSKSKLSIPR